MKRSILSYSNLPNLLNEDFGLWHYKDRYPKKIKFYSKEYYMLLFVLSGNITYSIEGKSYKLMSGDIMLLDKDPELFQVLIDPYSMYERIVIWINPNYMTSIGTNHIDFSLIFKGNSFLHLNTESVLKIKDILEHFEKESTTKILAFEIMKKTYLTELLVLLYRSYYQVQDEPIEIEYSYDEHISEIVEYINNNLNEDLSINTLSNKFHISKSYLQNKFKNNTGFTLYSFIQNKRLILASILLKKEEKLSVTEVCSKSGFNDYSNFLRLFKENFGVTPKKYSKII